MAPFRVLEVALATVCLWAVSPICFAGAGRRIGSAIVVWLRIALAALLLIFTPLITWLPVGDMILSTGPEMWWMALLGVFGLGLEDWLIYVALVQTGAQRTIQLLLLSPVVGMTLG